MSGASHPSSATVEAALEGDAPPGVGLSSRARRGAVWVALGYGGAQLLRFAGNLILTRLLFEEAFGVMALIASILQGLELFSDVGIGPSIIQNEREDRRFLDTAFTMQAGRGILLFFVASSLALPMARTYEEPLLVYLLPLCALNAMFAGFHSTNRFTLNRELDLGRLELTSFAAQSAGLATMVIWALLSPTVMALVAGSLVTGAVRTALTHLYLPGAKNRFAWDREAVRELIRFGRWIFVSTLLGFLAGQSDRLIFGKMVSMDLLGVYSIAITLAMMPSDALARLSMQVIFPLYSERVRDDDDARGLSDMFHRTRAPILALGGWAFAGLLAGGPTAVEMLYDERYQAAGTIVQLLAFGAWFYLLSSVYGAVVLALGAPKWTSAAALAKVLAMAGLIPGGYLLARAHDPDAGFMGAIIGFATAEVFRYLVVMLAARGYGLRGVARDAGLTLVTLGTGLAGLAGAVALERAGVHVVVRAAALAVGVTLLWLPLAWPHVRGRLKRRSA